jgi:tRNA dimethylallyltransferase
MKAIGIIEVLTYLDGRCSHAAMREKIITNTARLAKRQVTFNKSQFVGTIRGNIEELRTQLFLKQ